jgi:hypothetical protein
VSKPNVRFGSKADMCAANSDVRFTPYSDRESEIPQKAMSALIPKADMCGATRDVRFAPKADMLNKLSGKYSERKSAFLRFFRVWRPMECT